MASARRMESDAFHTLFLGYSQEYLDGIHKAADERKARFRLPEDFQPICYPYDSDSDFEDIDGAPMSPPRSPKEVKMIDVSVSAWNRRKLSDLAQGIETRDTGFDNYHLWQSCAVAEQWESVWAASKSLQKSSKPSQELEAIKPLPLTTHITRSERSVLHILEIDSPH